MQSGVSVLRRPVRGATFLVRREPDVATTARPGLEGERDATAYGPTVPKGDYPPQYTALFPEVVIPGEDCLNLNVWTPDISAAGLPVLVWIHGGSFMNGSGSVGAYDGTAFARDGVVCVTVNYRLAAEGFLYLDDGIANLGLLDQLAALRWVQGNISVFGGDPARVTVAGESAGAMSVTTLLSMPLAEGLFAQAIAESGAAAHTLTKDVGQMVGAYLADALGVPAGPRVYRGGPAGQARAGRIGPGSGGSDGGGSEPLGAALAELAAVRAHRGRLGPAGCTACFHGGRPGRGRTAADRVESRRGNMAVPDRGGHHRPHRRTNAGRRGRRLRARRGPTSSPSTGRTGRVPVRATSWPP